MLIFRSEEHVDRWCAQHDLGRGALMTPETCWQLARAWYENKLKADWRRHTVEGTERLLRRLGLTDAFWSLRPDHV